MYCLKENAALLSVESFKCMKGFRPLARVASIEAKVFSGAFKYCLDVINVGGRELIASVRSSADCLKILECLGSFYGLVNQDTLSHLKI